MANKEEVRKEYENTRLTTKQIAEKMDIKIGTLKSWMARDRKKGCKWTRKDIKGATLIRKGATKNKKVAGEVAKKGRPRIITTEEQLQKIRDSAALGLSIPMIALKTGIKQRTLYDYLENNEEFSQEIHTLMNTPRMNARINMALAVEQGDLDMSEFILTKTDEDFNPRKNIDMNMKEVPKFSGEDEL